MIFSGYSQYSSYLSAEELKSAVSESFDYNGLHYSLLSIGNYPLFLFRNDSGELGLVSDNSEMSKAVREYLLQKAGYGESGKQELYGLLDKFNQSLHKSYKYKYVIFESKDPLYDCPESFWILRQDNYSKCSTKELCLTYFVVYCMQRGCDAGVYASSLFKYIESIRDVDDLLVSIPGNILAIDANNKSFDSSSEGAYSAALNLSDIMETLHRNRLRLPDVWEPLKECPSCGGVCSVIPADMDALNEVVSRLESWRSIGNATKEKMVFLESGITRVKNDELKKNRQKLFSDFTKLDSELNLTVNLRQARDICLIVSHEQCNQTESVDSLLDQTMSAIESGDLAAYSKTSNELAEGFGKIDLSALAEAGDGAARIGDYKKQISAGIYELEPKSSSRAAEYSKQLEQLDIDYAFPLSSDGLQKALGDYSKLNDELHASIESNNDFSNYGYFAIYAVAVIFVIWVIVFFVNNLRKISKQTVRKHRK